MSVEWGGNCRVFSFFFLNFFLIFAADLIVSDLDRAANWRLGLPRLQSDRLIRGERKFGRGQREARWFRSLGRLKHICYLYYLFLTYQGFVL